MIDPRWECTRDQKTTVHDILLDDILDAGDTRLYELVRITRPASFRGSDVSRRAQEFTSAARAKHLAEGFGYWEFLLGSLSSGPEEIRRPVIDRAGFHSSGRSEDISVLGLRTKIETRELIEVEERSIISLSSRVRGALGQEVAHFPMLDFSLTSAPEHDCVAIEVLNSLGLSGYLFDSGRSYHFLGRNHVDCGQLRETLARAQLLAPYIDTRWASHSLIEGQCALRISTDTSRNVTLPRLVARSR